MTKLDILLVDLLSSNAMIAIEIFFGFISATSAFLVVGYLAAKELSAPLLKVAVALYSVTSFVLIFAAQRQGLVLVGIREQMGSNLTWHPAVYEAQWIFPTVIFGMPVVMTLLFVSATWYFLHARNAR